MGHVARVLEERGMATVVIGAVPFQDRMVAMHLPRLVITPHLMGRPLGPSGDWARQREVIRIALDLLDHAEEGGTVVKVSGNYRPGGAE